jgi:hypothetical protein
MDGLDNHQIADITLDAVAVPEEGIIVSIDSDVATARIVLEDNASGREQESVLNDGLPYCSWKKISKSWRTVAERCGVWQHARVACQLVYHRWEISFNIDTIYCTEYS